MQHGDYIVMEPLENIDWRLAVPYEDSGITVWISDTLSITYNQLTNGMKNFVLATNMLNGKPRNEFYNEIGIRYSEERVKKAIASDNVYAFFTKEEAERLEAIFSENKFFAKEVYIESSVNGRNIVEFDEDEYKLAIRTLRDCGATRYVPVTIHTEYDEQDIRQEMYDGARKNLKKQIPWFGEEHRHFSKKKVKRTITISSLLFGLGAASGVIGKKMIGKGVMGTITGMALCAIGSLAHLVAFKTSSVLVNKINEEVIFG